MNRNGYFIVADSWEKKSLLTLFADEPDSPRLARRAEMTAALANQDALDGSSTDLAGFACALVDPEVVLEIPTAVDPIDASPVVADALLQHLPDGCQQPGRLLEG